MSEAQLQAVIDATASLKAAQVYHRARARARARVRARARSTEPAEPNK